MCVPVKTAQGAFQVFFDEINAHPGAFQSFAHFPCHAAARKRVDNGIAGICQHAHEVFRDLSRISGGVRLNTVLLAIAEVAAIAFRMRQRDEIRGDRRAVIATAEATINVGADLMREMRTPSFPIALRRKALQPSWISHFQTNSVRPPLDVNGNPRWQ